MSSATNSPTAAQGCVAFVILAVMCAAFPPLFIVLAFLGLIAVIKIMFDEP